MKPLEIKQALNEMCQFAEIETMGRFRQPIDVDNKEDGDFDPVTLADKGAEKVIRNYIQTHFPDHGIFGEEEAPINENAEFCWIIDPIDGTRAYISGLPSWGTLIGLSHRGEMIAGVMHQPFTDEKYIAFGDISHLENKGSIQKLHTSQTKDLSQATMMSTTPELFDGDLAAKWQNIKNSVRMTRYGFDCYAYCMLAAGHIDLVVECKLNAYDIAPLIPIIENAGGIVKNWDNQSIAGGGNVIAAANQDLFDQALEKISSN